MLGRRLRCSFCRRPDSEVAKLVAGPLRISGRVYICDRCAAETIRIMGADAGGDQPRRDKPSLWRQTLNRLGWRRRHDPWHTECHAV